MTQDLGNLAWSGFSFRLEHEGQLGSARLGLTASPHGRATSRHFTPNRRQEWAIVDEELGDRPRSRIGGFEKIQRTIDPPRLPGTMTGLGCRVWATTMMFFGESGTGLLDQPGI